MLPVQRTRTFAMLIALASFVLPESAQAQKKTIRVGSVTVYSTKSNGKAWDAFNGAPDLIVQIKEKKFLGASKFTSKKQDTYSATFNDDTIRIGVGSAIEIIVYDKDVSSDDLVGRGSFVINRKDFNLGGIKFTNFGRVRELTILLR